MNQNHSTRIQVLVDGFKRELDGRLSELTNCRTELEKVYAQRIDDAKVDDPENSQYKESAMKYLRQTDSTLTSYNGSLRSIKQVLEALYNIICSTCFCWVSPRYKI